MSLRIRGGRWAVTVFVFEVVEPFFSVAAAPQHIPSWMRLPIPAGGPPAAVLVRTVRQAGTEYSVATVSRTRGRLNQLDARLGAESKWHIRLASCREGLFFPEGTRADTTVCFLAILLEQFSPEPLPPSPSPRPSPGCWGRGDGEGGWGGPFCRARAEVLCVYAACDRGLFRGGPPITYGSLYFTMCQMIVAKRRITATRAIFDPRRFLIR